MATVALVVIAFLVVVWLLVQILDFLASTVAQTKPEANPLLKRVGVSLFGRKESPLATLTEPPELARGRPWDPKTDPVTKQLNDWKLWPAEFPDPSIWPKRRPLWISASGGSTSANIVDVESLFRPLADCKPPYELAESPPGFPPIGAGLGESDPPSEPARVPEDYPVPVLSLPLWHFPFEVLNGFVRGAHARLVSRYRELLDRRINLEVSAPALNAARAVAWEKACQRNRDSNERFREYHAVYGAAKKAYEQSWDDELKPLRRAKRLITSGKVEGVELHFDLALRRLLLPSFVPREWQVRFEPETKTLLVEHRFPETARLEVWKVVHQSRGDVEKPVSQSVLKNLVPKIQPALCLQLARSVADADTFGLIDAVAINGWVDFFDRATGHPKRAYCASLVAKKESLLAVRLETADVVAAFNALRGANAGESYETAPVMPSLRLQTEDRRFVEARETIAKLAKGENLAAMDWEDFEHLVRELFEREFAAIGAEVKITRASRDQGVDAVIFDPDPLRGGKIVVQAKRYTIPVGVSAVRDLYGTVVNEGANTGILVTTSHYGPDAYEFAQNKPLKLINGAQLLGLLEKAGYKFRIDLAEARAMASRPN